MRRISHQLRGFLFGGVLVAIESLWLVTDKTIYGEDGYIDVLFQL